MYGIYLKVKSQKMKVQPIADGQQIENLRNNDINNSDISAYESRPYALSSSSSSSSSSSASSEVSKLQAAIESPDNIEAAAHLSFPDLSSEESSSSLLSEHLNECCICFQPIDPSTNNCTTKCGHKFCLECLLSTLAYRTDCPLCNQTITVRGPTRASVNSDGIDANGIDKDEAYLQSEIEMIEAMEASMLPSWKDADGEADDNWKNESGGAENRENVKTTATAIIFPDLSSDSSESTISSNSSAESGKPNENKGIIMNETRAHKRDSVGLTNLEAIQSIEAGIMPNWIDSDDDDSVNDDSEENADDVIDGGDNSNSNSNKENADNDSRLIAFPDVSSDSSYSSSSGSSSSADGNTGVIGETTSSRQVLSIAAIASQQKDWSDESSESYDRFIVNDDLLDLNDDNNSKISANNDISSSSSSSSSALSSKSDSVSDNSSN